MPISLLTKSIFKPQRKPAANDAQRNLPALPHPGFRPADHRADIRLVEAYGLKNCLQSGLLPVSRIGGATVVFCANTNLPAPIRSRLNDVFGPIRMAYAPADQIEAALMRVAGYDLAVEAETRVAEVDSCRPWDHHKARRVAATCLLAILCVTLVAPTFVLMVVLGWAILALILSTGLKLAAALTDLASRHHVDNPRTGLALMHPPVISILVPLYKEHEVAKTIIARMSALDYPADRLDVCLIVEDDDDTTKQALFGQTLPKWASVIEVPEGYIRTKPRALNYAMTRARGSIIGIYDAEDSPASDQLRKVAARFAVCGPKVACLQGVLDYFNPRTNWLSRCFTLEYATWFRLVLPGLQRLGLVIPLGGTTLFLRRDAIETVGGWDAHNVTEDADLGVRLARHGYKTELINSVTMEEANARAWPWVRQRSRWLKGYAMTWAVHMRNPQRLMNDLGVWRFFGVQMLFFGTLSAFVLAPVLWSFWLVFLGLPHPLSNVLGQETVLTLAMVFLGAELISLSVSALGVWRSGRGRLIPWALTLQVYFLLATVAVYKALWELLTKPFFWDKTEHGLHVAEAATPLPQPLPHPTAAE